jgi:hypothetical protein
MLRFSLVTTGLLLALGTTGCQWGLARGFSTWGYPDTSYLLPRVPRYGDVNYHNEYPTADFPPPPPPVIPAEFLAPPSVVPAELTIVPGAPCEPVSVPAELPAAEPLPRL